MVTFIAVLLLGFAGAHDNYSQVVDWSVAVYNSYDQAGSTPLIAYPNGEYLSNAAKPVVWGPSDARPDGKIFAPIASSKNTHWVEVKSALKALKPAAPAVTMQNDTYLSDAPNAPAIADQANLSDQKKPNTEVDTDKILSYFENVGYKKSSHEELGDFAIPNQSVAPLPEPERPAPDIR